MDADTILTPDQRVRVFVSSTLHELADERAAARRAIERLRLTPVMFELGARPYPPRTLYLAYLRQSHVFVGIYGEQYGWTAPDMEVSGLEDELRHAGDLPQLLYVRKPAPNRDPRLASMLSHLAGTSYRSFGSAEELETLLADDLAVLLTARFAVPPPARAALHVPRPASEFVGRRTEISELADLVTSEGVRLVTLTGPGGIGKTRLAIAVAGEVADRFPDGITFVPLAARGPDDFLEAVGHAVELKDLGQAPLPDLLAERLRDEQRLLVLDNFEHLVPVAEQVAALIEGTTALRCLVTSRVALRLTGEEEFPVPPLAVPRVTSRAEDVVRADAAQLFCRRVAAVRHGYQLTPQDAATVARICRRLDGLPLALELVAARANALSIEELAARLDSVLDLSARSPDVPARQRTLRTTMDWSHAQLAPAAARVFAQLGVFAGSFSVAAAEAVCRLDTGVDLIDALAELVDHSLLRPQLDAPTARFAMLQVVREYARSLVDPAELDEVRERHAGYYRDIALASYSGLRGTTQRATMAQLDLDADDLAAALDWLLEHDHGVDVADMCWSLWIYHWLRNSLTEGRRWTCAALADRTLPELQRGRLLAADGILSSWRGDYELAQQEVTEARAIADRTDDDDLRMLTSIMLVVVLGGLGDHEGVRATADDAIGRARRRGDRWVEACALSGLGWLQAALGDLAGNEQEFEDMLALASETQDPLLVAMGRDNMAELRMWQGRLRDAAVLVVDSLRPLVELRMAYPCLSSFHTAAELLSRFGRWADAVRVQAAGDRIADDINVGLWPPWLPRRDQLLRAGRERLGADEHDKALAVGRSWTLEQAAAETIRALERVAEPSPSSRATALEKVPPLRTAADVRVQTDPSIATMTDRELVHEIDRLRRARGAVILAHNYQVPAVQDLADFVGDSLQLVQQAAATPAETIVFCGVHFMAETAAIICPDKHVLIPDPEAACTLAASVTAEDIRAWRREHPGGVVVAYVNTDADVKAEVDYCCTSSNAVDVVAAIPPGRDVLFVPDQFLGLYVKGLTGRDMELWLGECHVHASIGPDDVDRLMGEHPEADLLLHPECGCVSQCLWRLAEGDLPADRTHVLSTGGMVRHARECPRAVDIVGTEVGMLHQLRKANSAKTFVPLREDAICSYMKAITLPKVYLSLRDDEYPIEVAPDVADRARAGIERMLVAAP